MGFPPGVPSFDGTVLSRLSLAPVAYWKLNDAAGSSTAADSSGNGYTLTAHGTVTFGKPSVVPTDSETAAQGDGSSGYLSAAMGALIPSGNASFTVLAACLISSAPSGDVGILSWGTAGASGELWQLNAGPSDSLGLTNWGAGNAYAHLPVIGQNVLVGASWDGASLASWINGHPLATGTLGVTPAVPSSGTVWVMSLGGESGDYAGFPIGRVAIFAGVLTPKDWMLLMQAFTGVG